MSTTTHNVETDFDLDISEMGPISRINTLSSPNDTDNTDFDETAYDTDFSEITPNPLFSSPIPNIVIEAGSNSNVTPNVHHDSTSNSIRFNIVEELIEAHGKRDRLTSLVLSKIEDDYKSGCGSVKYSVVKYLLEVFGEMLFENGFLNWLCRKINVRKPRLEACVHRYKTHETNQPRRQLPSETHASIYTFWLEDESSVVSTDCRSGRNDVRISKYRYLAEFNHL